jgi:hypothetical protein
MRQSLPLAILAVVAFLLMAMPWRRNDPRHEFMFELCKRLAEGVPACTRFDTDIPGSEETHSSGYRTAAGHHHGAGGPHV